MPHDTRGDPTRSAPSGLRGVAHIWPVSRRSDSGAVLILALVFIIVVSVTVGALAYWVTNGLNSTTQFYTGAQLQYAASAAVQTAVQSIAATPEPGDPPSSALNFQTPLTQATQQSVTVNGTTTTYAAYPTSPGVCWTPASGSVSSISFYNNSLTIAVYCSTLEKLTQSVGANGTRVVTFYACQYTSGVTTASTCQASPLLTAVFSFDDYPVGGGQVLTSQCNVEGLACGEGSTELSWVRG